ncbi:MAG: hypothetical protein FWE45_04495 [Firmicutes bacterium]|nr:hypothetical protein [Bacillota bacterium]
MNKERILSFAVMGLLALCMTVTGIVLAVWQPWVAQADGENNPILSSWQDIGNRSTAWLDRGDGDGTAGNPFLIGSSQELAGVAYRLNANLNLASHFRLTSNINLSGNVWESILNFTGTFDGDSFVINMPSVIRSPNQNIGLFASVTAANIMNLGISGEIEQVINTSGQPGHVGVLVGQFNGNNTANGTIRTVKNTANITVSSTSNVAVGGVVGRWNSRTARAQGNVTVQNFNLANTGDITVTAPSAAIGGIVGFVHTGKTGGTQNATIFTDTRSFLNVFNTGNISANLSAPINASAANVLASGVGGIIGHARIQRNRYNSPHGAASGVLRVEHAYNMGELTINGATSHARMRQIVGSAHGQVGGSVNSAQTNFQSTLVINNALGIRNDILVTMSNDRYGSAHLNAARTIFSPSRIGVVDNNGEVIGTITAPTEPTLLTQLQSIPFNTTWEEHGGIVTLYPFTNFRFGYNAIFNVNSPLFQITDSRNTSYMLEDIEKGEWDTQYTITVANQPTITPPTGIEFMGWATSQTRANAGTVDRPPGQNIVLEPNEPNLAFFAVYQFSPARTLTVQRGDGILASMSSFTSTVRRPGQFLSPAGVPSTAPYFAPFLQIPAVSGSGIQHIGWADSLQQARLGQVNSSWPLSPSSANQPHIFENTRIYAVWQRTDVASLQLRFSHDALTAGYVNETWFEATFPTITETFTTAQRTFALSVFAPITIVPYHVFGGWATTLARAQAGIVDHAPNATITIPYPNQAVTPLYAVFQPIRLTLFVNSVFNTGISPTPQFTYNAITPNRSLTNIHVTDSGSLPVHLTTDGMTLVSHGGATFEFLGWANSLDRAINGHVDFLGGGPTMVNVNGNVELHAVWNVLSGTPLPPIEGNPPIAPPVEGMNRLPAPQNVNVNQATGMLSWDMVPGSMGFRVYINGHPTIFFPNIPFAITEVNLSLFYFPLPPTETSFNFHIQVRAIGNNVDYTHSLLSSITVFNVNSGNYNPGGEDLPNVDDDEDIWDEPGDWDDEQLFSQLDVPTNLVINNNILTWTGVANSAGYRIYVDGVFQTTATGGNTFALSTLNLPVGTYSITLRANGSGAFVTSNHSDIESFEVKAIPVNKEALIAERNRIIAYLTAQVRIGYTTESLGLVDKQIANALDIINNTDATQGQVDIALTQLIIAYNGLMSIGGTQVLDTPTNLEICDNNILTWDSVTNADGYRIYVDGVLFTIVPSTDREVDFSALPVRVHSITIIAYSNNFAINDSEYAFIQYDNRPLFDDDWLDDEDFDINDYLPEDWTPEDGWPCYPFPWSPPAGFDPENPNFPWYQGGTDNGYDDPTFFERVRNWLRDNWWVYIVLAAFLIWLLLLIIVLMRRGAKTTINVVNPTATVVCTLEADANAAIAEARAKLQVALPIVISHDAQPQNAALEQTARTAVMSADQALDKAVNAVAKYKQAKNDGGKKQ